MHYLAWHGVCIRLFGIMVQFDVAGDNFYAGCNFESSLVFIIETWFSAQITVKTMVGEMLNCNL